eukprot:m.263122 g.263122  ORF g.263122 m.263122 type:complete len:90 (+) comp40453_c2_seq39:3389-3658(+)
MGFSLTNELEFEGHFFMKGKYKVALYKVLKIDSRGDKQDAGGQTRILELSTVILAGPGQEATVAEMNAFIDQLKPLVVFSGRGDASAAS